MARQLKLREVDFNMGRRVGQEVLEVSRFEVSGAVETLTLVKLTTLRCRDEAIWLDLHLAVRLELP